MKVCARHLNICGGDFYADDLIDLLEHIGWQLESLELYYVDQFDIKALAMISVYCKKLTKLSFSNCGFKETIEQLTQGIDSYERYGYYKSLLCLGKLAT